MNWLKRLFVADRYRVVLIDSVTGKVLETSPASFQAGMFGLERLEAERHAKRLNVARADGRYVWDVVMQSDLDREGI